MKKLIVMLFMAVVFAASGCTATQVAQEVAKLHAVIDENCAKLHDDVDKNAPKVEEIATKVGQIEAIVNAP